MGTIRIKDIAERAGVSVGTVDRVLHQRPNVSPKARQKVEKAIEEMGYKPNAYASALAYNREYHFHCLMPRHAEETYWQEIEKGLSAAEEHRREFHIDLKIHYYDRLSDTSFTDEANALLAENPDGVVLVPGDDDATREFARKMNLRNVPFILLDSYIPDVGALSFFGQDSLQSGYFAGRMLMLIASGEKQVLQVRQTRHGHLMSRQQQSREEGFRKFMREHCPQVEILELNLPVDEEQASFDDVLEDFFSKHPDVHHCITFNSKAYIVGEFLLRTGRKDVQIMGYDIVSKNAECCRRGSVSFLIAQHAFMQGYHCVETLFRATVLQVEVPPVNFMPIELITAENIDYYHRMM